MYVCIYIYIYTHTHTESHTHIHAHAHTQSHLISYYVIGCHVILRGIASVLYSMASPVPVQAREAEAEAASRESVPLRA